MGGSHSNSLLPKEILMSYFKTSDGTDLFYSVWGKGHPLLLIHGGNIGADVWEFQVPYLVDHGYSCIVYDQLGFARSDCSASGNDFDTFADDLAALIDHLDLKRFAVVAVSLDNNFIIRCVFLQVRAMQSSRRS